jgi:hypothetical protein
MGQLTDLPAKGNGPAMSAFDRLRRERVRGITLEEITKSTKISRRHLGAGGELLTTGSLQ